MSHHTLCCIHPQPRIDSPEPPSRPSVSMDSIFAAAALPEDHPHALRFGERRKPESPASNIVRSPTLATKIKSQFRRKSLHELRSEKPYDADALAMTSTEVVDNVGHSPYGMADTTEDVHGRLRMLETPLGGNFEEDVRASVLRSLNWLRPVISKPSDFIPSRPDSLVDIATRVAARQDAAEFLNVSVIAPKIPISQSSPSLLRRQSRAGGPIRRTQSVLGLGSMLSVPLSRTKTLSSISSGPASPLDTPSLIGNMPPQVDGTPFHYAANDIRIGSPQPEGQLDQRFEPDSVSHHLHTMAISQQLRSMSAMSDEAGEEDLLLELLKPRRTWASHNRVRSGGMSVSSAHASKKSVTVEDVAALGRVRSPAASSVYSRPSSAGGFDTDKKEYAPYEISEQLDTTLSGWPLHTSVPLRAISSAVQDPTPEESAATRDNEPAHITTEHVSKSNTPSSCEPVENDHASMGWQSSLKSRLQSKKSSSTLTTSSKRHKFLERFSPPKRAVKKRRLIFKFLRPGSRTQQLRSISSPMLCVTTSQTSGLFDGPSDDSNLLTVHYELADNPRAGRSASVSNLSPNNTDDTTTLSLPVAPQRRPSMADYERHLTIVGDDRRRPSAINLQKLEDIREDDRRQSTQLLQRQSASQLRRPSTSQPQRNLSRAKPLALNQNPTGIMARALEKHHEEKSLFRSASKQREAQGIPDDLPPPVFSDTLATSQSSPPRSSFADVVSLLDPFTRPDATFPAAQSQSAGYLLPPGANAAPSSSPGSTKGSFNSSISRRPSTVAIPPEVPSPPRGLTKIESSLESWSRWPSHTRADRGGPATRADAVITRDFAFDPDPEDVRGSEGQSEGSETGPESKRHNRANNKHSLKRRSTMFESLKNYYSNVFSASGSNTAQNRRSSVSAGGWLANPDLELLAPASSSEPTSSHHDHHFKRRLQELEHDLEEAVRGDVAYVGKEAVKIEHQLMEDIEFVEDEAVKLEDYLRKDVEYVEEEAEKLMHVQHPQHHNQLVTPTQPKNDSAHLFREDSLFRANTLQTQFHNVKHHSTMMGPMDEAVIDPLSTGSPLKAAERNIMLDGAGSEPTVAKNVSKAEAWSATYKECLIRRESTGSEHDATHRAPKLRIHEADNGLMGPPALKPIKTRSPEQQKRLDPKASVRCFPSVTVVDDRKGHARSVSLISVKVDGGRIYRSSTSDLVHLIQAREREERDKLLRCAEDYEIQRLD